MANQLKYNLAIDNPGSTFTNGLDILSWSWGASNSSSGNSSGAGGVGRAEVDTFTFSKKVNYASPMLMVACFSGEKFSKVTLTCTKGGEKPFKFLIVRLTGCTVADYRISEHDDIPMESFELSFSTVDFKYVPQKDDGKSGDPVDRGWNLATNKPLPHS